VIVALWLVHAAWADVVVRRPELPRCSHACDDGSDATWCDAPECNDKMAADGWVRSCDDYVDHTTKWCPAAPAAAAGWCSTVGFGQIGVGAMLLVGALVRRPSRP
jgi:hypothetical protein